MADVTNIKFLYPPNFEGAFLPGTASGHRHYIVQCTNISDGTGEADSIKLKREDLLTVEGNVPTVLVVEKVDYEVSGMTVKVSYNNLTDDVVGILQGSGCLDFTRHGGFVPMEDDSDVPGNGDIVFDTFNSSLGDTYNITLTVKAKD